MSERGNLICNLQLEQRAANAPVVAFDLFSVTAQLVLVSCDGVKGNPNNKANALLETTYG